MKLYTSIGPNPRVVRMFMAERGIELPTQTIDLPGAENRREPYITKVNSRGQTPALELDNGAHITEITAICEYLDEKFPGTSLIGTTAEERAQTRMWTRRIDLTICEPLANGFRFSAGKEMFKDRIRVLPEAAEGLKLTAADNLAWLNAQMGDKTFICGDRFSLADVLAYCFITFGKERAAQPLAEENSALHAWYARVAERPSTQV